MSTRRPPLLLTPALALALTVCPAWGEEQEPLAPEPLVTTTWEVRQATSEVINALRKRHDIPAVLERTRALLAEHGDALIATEAAFVPLADLIASELSASGLAETFTKTYAVPSQNALQACLAAGGDTEVLRQLARTFPGTTAAAEAWRILADRSWDYGRLGTYLGAAHYAGDAEDEQRAKRVTAARDLIAVVRPVSLPDSLELAEMWRLDLPVAEVAENPMGRRRGSVAPVRAGFVLSDTDGDLTAASDGITCFVFDHLVGSRIGELHTIGRMALPTASCRPAAWANGFVALGQDRNGTPSLTCIDRSGRQVWRSSLGAQAAGIGGVSAPVIIDDVVAVAALGANEDGPELRVIARRLADGELAWDRFVAKLPVLLGRQMFFTETLQGPPILIRHNGGLLLLPSTGLLAELDGLGSVQRIWTYPSKGLGGEDRFNRRQQQEGPRQAGLVSDGRWAVATPSDADGFAWILSPEGGAPQRYQADGARGTAVAIRDGRALLVGKQTTMISCPEGKPVWHRATGVDSPSGSIGERTALIAGMERLTLVSTQDGSVISDRGAAPPLAFAACDGMLVVAGRDSLVAYGNSEAFIAEQKAAILRNPDDHRAYVALGKIWAAQGNGGEAYEYLVKGLERGAPVEYATVAARLVRDQLEGSVDDSKTFPAHLARFERLSPFATGLASEAAFWRARYAERHGNTADAVAGYRSVLTHPPSRIELGVGRDTHIDASLTGLAEVGLARLGAIPVPPWLAALPKPAKAVTPTAWRVETSRSRSSLLSHDVLLGYEGGRLTARRVADGSVAWVRTPDLRLLGVRMTGQDAAHPGVPIEVLDGTAAAAAGLRSGDVITSFNELPIRDFHRDLIPAVAESAEGAPFEIAVMRGADRLIFKGHLGGELVEAFAASERVVLAWPVMPMAGKGGPGEGMWVSALSQKDGSEILRWPLPPITQERLPAKPILAPDDLMITSDGEDLVAIDLGAEDGQRERWRVAGQAALLDHAKLFTRGALLISEPANNQFRLLDLRNGETLITVGANADTPPLLAGSNLLIRSADERILCWDLGTGRLRWRSELTASRLLAAKGDAVFVIDARKRLHILDNANGRVRRQYGDWTSIDDIVASDDRLVMSVRRDDGSRAVASISVPAGSPLFERQLPRGSEIREFHVNPSGCLLILAEPGQRPSALALRPDGEIASARHLADQDGIVPLGDGYLLGGVTSLAGVPFGIDAIPLGQPLNVPQVREGANLLATIQDAGDTLVWHPLGEGAYAVLGVGRSLIIVARMPAGTETIQVRIGTGTGPIDMANQVLIFQRHRVARFNDLDTGWRVGSVKKIPSTDTWIYAARLDPPAGLAPGTPIAILPSLGENVGDAPWWLRRTWRTIMAPVTPLALPVTP